MGAAYDTYDYPSYWLTREYEHKSEFLAIKKLLERVPNIKKILEIGTGYGRLVPAYSFRAKKIILSDPSAKLLGLARKTYQNSQDIDFIQSSVGNIASKVRRNSVDLIVVVRVLHHVTDIKQAIEIFSKLIKKGGYLIIEFANKSHLKAIFTEITKGNLTFPLDIFPRDIRCRKSIKAKTLPFINYHPDAILHLLKQNNFEIVEKLSVSNIRFPFLKKLLALDSLLWLEEKLQRPLNFINFGPSIFVLAKKRG